MTQSIIAAYAMPSRALGFRGRLPWHLPDDLARFKRLTMGHAVIMGRRTHSSLGGRPLPGRQVIVVSTSLDQPPTGAQAVAATLEAALDLASDRYQSSEAFIAGGGQVYAAALQADLVDRMYLTLVEAEVEADTFFPQYEASDWVETYRQAHPADERHPFAFTYVNLARAH